MSDFLTATMTLVDESTVSLSEGSIASGSWSFKKTTGSGGYEIGGCAISSCNFTIIDTVGNYNENDFENAEVSVFLNGSTTPYWKGYVKTATQAYNKIVITAYDKMAKGDEQVIGYINSTGKINMTRSDLASAIATFMGLTGVTGLNNGSAVIPEMDTTCTYRQAIAYMAEAGGQFAYVDTVNDRLVFAWYSGTETPASIFGRNLSRSGTTIDCVNVIAYDGEYAEISPSLGDMLIEVSGNPCIVGNRDTGTFTTDLTNIVNALVGNTFISGTLTIASDPDLEIGTYINLSHHGQPYLLPVASLTYKPNGTMVISCDNVGNMKVSSADMRSTSAQQSLYNDISNKKSKLAQALGQGGGGSNVSVRQIITNGIELAGITIDSDPEKIIYAPYHGKYGHLTTASISSGVLSSVGGSVTYIDLSTMERKSGNITQCAITRMSKAYFPDPSIWKQSMSATCYGEARIVIDNATWVYNVPCFFEITIAKSDVEAMGSSTSCNCTIDLKNILPCVYSYTFLGGWSGTLPRFTSQASFINVLANVSGNISALMPASTTTLGGITVDGSDLSVDTSGLLSISQDTDSDVYDEVDNILNGT